MMRRRSAIAAMMAAFVLFDLFAIAVLCRAPGMVRYHTDFYAFWTFSCVVAAHPAAALYDPERLHAYQLALHLTPGAFLPYLYPPSFLLVLWPLHLLPERQARVAWTVIGLLLYLAALRSAPFGRRDALAALVLPATILCVVAGQNGFLTAALMIGGLRLLPRRPWLGGVLLGLLSIKPQLCILLPVALVAARQWRGLAAATLAALALVALSSSLFGRSIWVVWLQQAPVASAYLARHYVLAEKLHAWPTVAINLRGAGVGAGVALSVQLASAAAVAVAVWSVCRHGAWARAVALLPVGTFLATPYAAFYDETLVAAAVLLTLQQDVRPFSAAVLAMAAWLPLLIWLPPMPLVAPAVLSTLFVVILLNNKHGEVAAPERSCAASA